MINERKRLITMKIIKKLIIPVYAMLSLWSFTSLAKTELPMDDNLTVGTLDNGMKYVIYPHANPKGQVNLWLQVHSGSLQEDDDQLGVAHFVEHMLFNGTQDYPGNGVIENFESMGLKFGRDVNAYTTYHETVYQVNMANDNLKNMQQVMDIFYNWAELALFAPEEVEAERGVIIEEWRANQGIKWRNNQQRRPLLLAGTRHLEREPIGLTEIINTISPERVKDYYSKWYQPQNMTFYIVGDIDKTTAVDLIKSKMSQVKVKNSVEKMSFDTQANEQTQFKVIADQENISNSFAIIYRQPRIFARTNEDFTNYTKQALLTQLFNQRMYDLLQTGNLSDIASIKAMNMPIAEDYQGIHFRVLAKNDDLALAISRLFSELQRIDNDGFTQEELSHLKRTQLSFLENAANNASSRDAKMLTARIANSIFYDVPMLSPQSRYDLTKQTYDNIELAQINQEWQKLRENKDIIYEQLVTEKVAPQAYTPQQILSFAEQTKESPLAAYQVNIEEKQLMTEKPNEGQIVDRVALNNQVTELTLSNGAKVIVYPTDFNDNNVYLTAISDTGLYSFAEQDYHAAKMASKVVNLSGLNDLTASELKDWSILNFANINTMVQPRNTVVSISGNNQKLAAMFQLMHQRFKANKISEDIWQVVKQSQENEIKALAVQPKSQFNQALYEIRFNDNRARPITEEKLSTITPEYLLSIDQRLFTNPADFKFIIVGNVNVDEIAELSADYLASLTTNTAEPLAKPVDLARNHNDTAIRLNIENEPFSQVVEYWNHPLPKEQVTEKMRQELAAFNFVLARDLRLQIRETESGAYSVSSLISVSPLTGDFDYRLTFSCAPDRAYDLLNKARNVVKARIEKGISQSELDEYQKMQLRMVDVQKSTNSQLSRLLLSSYMIYDDLTMYDEIKPLIEKLTVEEINKTAQEQFKRDNQIINAVLLPKKQEI